MLAQDSVEILFAPQRGFAADLGMMQGNNDDDHHKIHFSLAWEQSWRPTVSVSSGGVSVTYTPLDLSVTVTNAIWSMEQRCDIYDTISVILETSLSPGLSLSWNSPPEAFLDLNAGGTFEKVFQVIHYSDRRVSASFDFPKEFTIFASPPYGAEGVVITGKVTATMHPQFFTDVGQVKINGSISVTGRISCSLRGSPDPPQGPPQPPDPPQRPPQEPPNLPQGPHPVIMLSRAVVIVGIGWLALQALPVLAPVMQGGLATLVRNAVRTAVTTVISDGVIYIQ